jgi:choline dehydrogenase
LRLQIAHLRWSLEAANPQEPAAETYSRIATHAFIKTEAAEGRPDIQIMCMQIDFSADPLPLGRAFSGKVVSRGTLTPTGTLVTDPLTIDPGYLREERDWNTLIAGIDHCLALGATRALRPFVSGTRAPMRVGMNRRELREVIASTSGSGLHFAGTCAAGRHPNDSVVDANFRVWGIERLRIVDASVIPDLPGVNPQVSILTLAELAATLLR